MKIHYNQKLRLLSRELRKDGTLGEVLLWKELKARKLGFQFLRQKPIGEYIVDFCAPELHLAIEVDGISHDVSPAKDEQRQQELEKLGFHFLRFTEGEVRGKLDSVLSIIEEWIREHPPLR